MSVCHLICSTLERNQIDQRGEKQGNGIALDCPCAVSWSCRLAACLQFTIDILGKHGSVRFGSVWYRLRLGRIDYAMLSLFVLLKRYNDTIGYDLPTDYLRYHEWNLIKRTIATNHFHFDSFPLHYMTRSSRPSAKRCP